MTEKLLNISNIASCITGAFAALVVLFGAFKFIDSTNDTITLSKQMVLKVDSIYKAFDNVQSQSYRVNQSIQDLQLDIVSLTRSLDNTQKSYGRYLMRDNSLTKEEFYQYMDGLTVEKVSWQDTLKTSIKIYKKQ